MLFLPLFKYLLNLAWLPICILLILITLNFWPSALPFELFQVWQGHEPLTVSGVVGAFSLLLLVRYGAKLAFVVLHCVFSVGVVVREVRHEQEVMRAIRSELRSSRNSWLWFDITHAIQGEFEWGWQLMAYCYSIRGYLNGMLDELMYRWIFFYGMMILLSAANGLLVGLSHGFALLQWLYVALLRPVDIVTFHQLHAYLFLQPWAAGAALLLSHGQWLGGRMISGRRQVGSYDEQKDGHIGIGEPFHAWLFLTWFPGMFFFLLMLKYGLFISIVAHTICDLLDMFIFSQMGKRLE